MEIFVRTVRGLSLLCGIAAAALIASAVVIVCQMVFIRYVLNENTIWQTDFVTFSLVGATFIGAPYVLMTKGHVNVDVLPMMVGERARFWLAIVATVVSLVFALVMTVLTFQFWQEAWENNWVSDSMWRARLYTLWVDADRARRAYAAIYRRSLGAGDRSGAAVRRRSHGMSPAAQGTIVLVATILVLLTGAPVAFSLGFIGLAFLVLFQGVDALGIAAETLWSGLHDFTLVSIPMFIMMGAAIGSSPAGRDLYIALDRWLYRVPGGLVVSNLGACALFAALTGSSPATCAAIGKMGIPEMRKRGYPDEVATGSICAGGTLGILIPPSITFILYGIATETSIGRLFLAGVMPGLMLTALFMAWTIGYLWIKGFRAYAADFRYSWREKFQSIPKVAPFLVIVFGVMYVLYGGIATPSEAAGVGAALCVVLAMLIYRIWNPFQWWSILRDTTRESVMILMIIGAAVLFSYMLSSLFITQTLAQAIADLQVNRWVLMLLINVFLLVCGCFIPPAGIILMTSPILLPIILNAGFDPVWFGVIVTVNMEVGLITPPVGLNLFVVNAIAPEVPTRTVLLGALPYVIAMLLGIVILCIFPEIATWLPDTLMGPGR